MWQRPLRGEEPNRQAKAEATGSSLGMQGSWVERITERTYRANGSILEAAGKGDSVCPPPHIIVCEFFLPQWYLSRNTEDRLLFLEAISQCFRTAVTAKKDLASK